MIKRDVLALNYSHTHDVNGNRLYLFANVFKYVLNVEGATEVTLPDDPDIIVMAATAYTGFDTKETAPIYDTARVNDAPVHKLTVIDVNGNATVSEHHEGANILISSQKVNKNGMFERFDGDADIVWRDKDYAMVEMGNADVTVRPVYSNFGENVVYKKPCKESGMTNESEQGNRALNGESLNKWCTPAGVDGTSWLEVDIGEVTPIYKWLVQHCGEAESPRWNTSDFRLEYKVNESDEWQIADSVEGNTENITIREFAPVNARFLRLVITKPTQGNRDVHCRIYQMHVYKCK